MRYSNSDLDKIAEALNNKTAQLFTELRDSNPHVKLSEFTRLGFCSMLLTDIKRVMDNVREELD